MTDDLSRFLESLEGRDPDWIYTVDTAALDRLRGEERDIARQELLSSLNPDDPRIPPALVLVGNAEVRNALMDCLPNTEGRMRVATAAALLLVGGPEDALAEVQKGLKDPDSTIADEALEAALKIGPRCIDMLIEAMATYPDDQIRIGAALIALFLAGVNDDPMSRDHRDIVYGLASDEKAERQKNFDALCDLMKRPKTLEVI